MERLVSVALFLAFAVRSRVRLIASGRYPASRSAEPGLSSARYGVEPVGQRRSGRLRSPFYHSTSVGGGWPDIDPPCSLRAGELGSCSAHVVLRSLAVGTGAAEGPYRTTPRASLFAA